MTAIAGSLPSPVCPLVSSKIITDNLSVQWKYGDAVAAIPCTEVVFVIGNHGDTSSKKSIKRSDLRRTQTPHSYRLGDIWPVHEKPGRKASGAWQPAAR